MEPPVIIIDPRISHLPNISLEVFKQPQSSLRAGIIPYATDISGKQYLLLGLERRREATIQRLGLAGTPREFRYSDFGGGCKKTESSYQCAMRELREESRDLLKIDPERATMIVASGTTRLHQIEFIVPVNDSYDGINDRFSITDGQKELSGIVWVEYPQIKRYTNDASVLTDSLRNAFINMPDVLP